ncbi:MAG: hypothetical protein RL625_1244 [Gemmatimonadota bacterium]
MLDGGAEPLVELRRQPLEIDLKAEHTDPVLPVFTERAGNLMSVSHPKAKTRDDFEGQGEFWEHPHRNPALPTLPSGGLGRSKGPRTYP